ncbi:glycosyltransferase family 39 protein [Leptolyngbya sp. CCNP1308]|uniref:glycosyltransferase family 39 protein n=1 Tax=Leptolyngbya sp. CCNP1308 TaxID=3110255 RepID=UPI002B21BECF|nr:glycosyltransferase family 39 protein [Leptolyngbya sp. CCNP1308]MEA5448605.1 glycosyltransferase family 39 protein [Leptolyngbya sp. CCNP1308]
MIAALAFVAVVLLERVITQPFTNYDTLWFHGPIVARWYQTAAFSQLDPLGHWIIEHPDAQVYPYNWHILFLLCLLPLGQDSLLAFPMLLAWLMLGLSVYGLGRLTEAKRFYSLAAAALVLFVPFGLNHVTTLQIDLPLAAVYTASLYYLGAYAKTRQSRDAGLFLAMTGLMAGIKTIGIIYSAFLIALLAAIELLARLSSAPNRPLLKQPLVWVGILALICFGGFWPIKHALEADFPTASALAPNLTEATVLAGVGPVMAEPSIWANLVAKGVALQRTTLTAQFDPTNLSHWVAISSQAITRLQLPFLLMLLQVITIPIVIFSHRQKEKNAKVISVVFLILLTTFFLYWNTPYTSGTSGEIPNQLDPMMGNNMRYGFPVLGILGVATAFSTSLLSSNKNIIVGLVLLCSLLGVTSSALFDEIRAIAFLGKDGFWPGKIIYEFRAAPGRSVGVIVGSLTQIDLLSILLYALAFAGLMGFLIYKRRIYSSNLLHYRWLTRSLKSIFSVSHPLACGIGCISLLCLSIIHLQSLRDINRIEIYQNIDGVLEQYQASTEHVAYFASQRSYLFYGKHFNYSVIHLPPSGENLNDWINSLRQVGVTLVAAGPVPASDYWFQVLSTLSAPGGPLKPLSNQEPDRGPMLYRLEAA